MAAKHPAASRTAAAMSTTPRQAAAMASLRMGDDYHNRDGRGILPLAEEAFDHATSPCRALARVVRGSHAAHRRGAMLPPAAAQALGTLVLGLDQEPPTLDPHASPSAVTYQIIASVTENLV